MRYVIISLIAISLLLIPYVAFAQNVEYIGSYDSLCNALRVYVSGNYAFVADFDSGLQIIDVSNPTDPILTSRYATPDWPVLDVVISGSYGYLACGGLGGNPDWYGGCLEAIDISNITNPSYAGRNDSTYGKAYDIFISGNYAYVLAHSYIGSPFYMDVSSEVLFNISDPSNLFLVWSDVRFPRYSPYLDVFISGDYLYDIYNGLLRIRNISDPANPIPIGSYSATMQEIMVVGNYVYGADFSGLLIINIYDPTNPVLTDSCDVPGYPNSVFVNGIYAYVAAGDSGFAVIDVIDPSNSMMVGYYDTPGSANDVFVSGDYIYVADGSSLQILRFTPTGIEEGDKLPSDFSPSQNYPNPFNAQTTIQYSIPKESMVSIDIFDILGCRIRTIDEGLKPAGNYQAVWDASNQASGIYFYRFKAGEYIEMKKIVLMK